MFSLKFGNPKKEKRNEETNKTEIAFKCKPSGKVLGGEFHCQGGVTTL